MLTAAAPKTNAKESIKKGSYSVEFFHIYTDERISYCHKRSLDYLKALDVWTFPAKTIILIDNYNPTDHKLSAQSVLDYLESKSQSPDFWAFEADLVDSAKELLDSVSNKKLKKSYKRYIEQHGKYPCSLLTASWYLTRLGVFDAGLIKSLDGSSFTPADRLVNILPTSYQPVESKAYKIIVNCPHFNFADKIQNLFYDAEAERSIVLF